MVRLLMYMYFGRQSFHVIATYQLKVLKFCLLIKTAVILQTVKMQTLLKKTLIVKEKILNIYERCSNISLSVYLNAFLKKKKLYNYIF